MFKTFLFLMIIPSICMARVYLRDQYDKTPTNHTDQYFGKQVSLLRKAFPDMYKDEPQKQPPKRRDL